MFDRDIWTAAEFCSGRYGDNATLEAGQRARRTRGAGGRETRRAPASRPRPEASVMPMYYFHVETGGGSREPQGLRLREMAAARNHAKTLDDAIRVGGDNVQPRRAIIVMDEQGAVVYEIRHDH